MSNSDNKDELKKLKQDGNLTNLSFQYYDTLIQLAELKRSKQEFKINTEQTDKKVTKKRKIVVLNHRRASILSNFTHMSEDNVPTKPTPKLLPAFNINETQLNQLPASIFKEKEHTINKQETHLLTPGKIPTVRVIKSKSKENLKNKNNNNNSNELFKPKDINILQKAPVNMRDLLTRKTSFDISPNGKKDLISELKPISKSSS